MATETKREEKRILGRLHWKTDSGTWRPYSEAEAEIRERELMDNPAPAFMGDDDDK